MNKGFNYNKTLLNVSTTNSITNNMTSIFVENAVDEVIDGHYTFNNSIDMNNNNIENINQASYNLIKTNIIGEKTLGSNVDFINSIDMNNHNIIDANFYGDVYSSGGQKILENGTDGTDAKFAGELTGNLLSSLGSTIIDYNNQNFIGNNLLINPNGTIKLYNAAKTGWAQIHYNEAEDAIQLQRGIIPSVDKYWNIGSTTKRVNNIYSETFTGNLTGNVSGNLTGDIYSSGNNLVLDNGTNGNDANFYGNLNGSSTLYANRNMLFTYGGFGVNNSNNLPSHPSSIDGYPVDGYFYRLDGQFHLMVDDLFFITDDSTSGPVRGGQFRFDTRDGTFRSSGSIFSNQGFLSFTGIHEIKETYEEYGLIVESTGNVDKTDKLNTIVETKLSNTNKSKSVYGVSYNSNETIGVVSLGEATMLVTNFGGNIMNGDYICSSEIPGFGMLQDDDLLHNYTVAKSTENIDWDNITDTIEHNGQSYKKVLIAVTLHCG